MRQRKDVGENPIPSDRHFDIPQEFADFVLHDSGKEDSERIIVFGDRFMLTELETSKFWLADGTIKLSPTLFYQIYTIHASFMETTPACVYAFLPSKTEMTYRRFLDIILKLAPNSAPEKILVDFENAVIQSFAAKFPMSSLSGCYFHLTQNFNKKIAELGLKLTYQNNAELALAFRMIPALAFEQLDRIDESFEKVVGKIMDVCARYKLEQDIIDITDHMKKRAR